MMAYINSSASFKLADSFNAHETVSESRSEFEGPNETSYTHCNFTSEQSSLSSPIMVDELFSLYQSAKLFSHNADKERLKLALIEAVRLKSSDLFPAYIKPQVSVDECGEFMFTYKNSTGYIDIGVCGEGEISFHARNDVDKTKTAFGDKEWNGNTIPDDLIEGVTSIFEK